jgi:DNA-binding HxlR family transcriptional regulator
MPIRRTYADHGDACAAAHGFDLVGDRWAVIVIRELMLGPKRFSELMADAHGATPSLISLRLRELEQAGIVRQIELPPPARVSAYELTEWGREFEPILQALGRWAQGSPSRPDDGTLTPDAAILALRTMATGPPPTPGLSFDLGLQDCRAVRPVQTWYHLSWGPDPLVAEKRLHPFESGDAIACDAAVWSDLLFGDRGALKLLESDAVSSQGDGRRLAKKFVARFRELDKLRR